MTDSQAYTTIIRVTYGLNVLTDADGDDFISIFAEAIRRVIAEGLSSAELIDLFPVRECRTCN